jgi:hypothetical protein
MTPRTKWALCDEHLGAAFRVPSEALFANAVLMEPADDTALQNSQRRERRLQYIPFRGYPLHYLCPGGTVSQCSSSTANRGRVGDLHYYGEEINAARVHCYRV